MVQLFMTLRSLQKVITMLDKRLDPTLRDLSETIAGLRKTSEPSSAASIVGAAAVPAVLAALQAFKAHMATKHENEKEE